MGGWLIAAQAMREVLLHATFTKALFAAQIGRGLGRQAPSRWAMAPTPSTSASASRTVSAAARPER